MHVAVQRQRNRHYHDVLKNIIITYIIRTETEMTWDGEYRQMGCVCVCVCVGGWYGKRSTVGEVVVVAQEQGRK